MASETHETIQSLRTTHWDFNDKPVAKEDIETIIAHSMRAANSDNLTDYSVVVVDDPAVLNVISGGESKGRKATCLVYAIDHTRIVQCARMLGYNDFQPLNRLYNFFIAMYDVCAAAQTAVIAAKALGIDALTTNFAHRQNPGEIMKLLDMPAEYCFPVIQVVLGYSDQVPTKTTGRISPKHIIHYGKYRPVEDGDTQAIIAEMDKVYPDYVTEKHKRAMDWYFTEWLRTDWFTEDVYQHLSDALVQSRLLVEPTLNVQG